MEMKKGGVKDSTNMRYIKNFAEYWKTLRNLGISDEEIWSFPTDEWLLQAYIVDCAVVRQRTNTYDTIRNKLRAVDYIAQCIGVKQEYHTSPALDAVIKHCKKRNKGKGSNTIPITIERSKLIIQHILRNKIAINKLDEWDKKSISNHWSIYNLNTLNKEEIEWYQMCIIIIMAITLGLRGAEQLKNEEKEWKDYGIKLKDIKWIWKNKEGRKFTSSKYTKNHGNLETMELRLRNSKTKGIGEVIKLILGNNKTKIRPISLIYEWFHQRKKESGEDWKNNFLFSLTLQQAKKNWKKIIQEMQVMEPEKWRYHGLRKGFATSLQQREINQGLIAYAGRWSLVESIYKYMIFTLEDMQQIASLIWDKKRQTMMHTDLDEWEIQILKDMRKIK